MTAYATRAPLHLINNPHIMSEASRGQSRRTSARLAEKEDVPYVNGMGHDSEPMKGRQIVEGKQAKGKLNGASTKPTAKRKPGENLRPLKCGGGLRQSLAKQPVRLFAAFMVFTDWLYSLRRRGRWLCLHSDTIEKGKSRTCAGKLSRRGKARRASRIRTDKEAKEKVCLVPYC